MVQLTPNYNCAVIDDFLLDAQELVTFATGKAADFSPPERAYPGYTLPLNSASMQPIQAFIQKTLSGLFSFCRGGVELHSQLSLTTVQPSEFSWIQRLPHSDPRLAGGRLNYAAMLYLFDRPELGGTGFYHWKDPEYWEAMSARQAEDPDAGLEELQQGFEMFRQPACYTTVSNEAVDLIDHVAAKFNRLIFYSGDLPHNAFIEHPELLSKDPAKGRLTLNVFASVVPK